MSLSSIFRNDKSKLKLSDGTKIEIKPLNVKQTFIVEGLFAPAAADFALKGDAGIEFQAEHADAFISVVAASLGKPVAYVEEMLPEDFNRIWAKLLEVNRDFFHALVRRAAAAGASKPRTGQVSSNS